MSIIIMNVIKFYDREKELKLLRSVKKPFLAIVYGRRRVGKTRLLLEYVKNEDFLYFFVNPEKNNKILLEEFVEQMRNKIKLPTYVRPANWREFLDLLFSYDGIVIFDEFQWFNKLNPSFIFDLQKFWDTREQKPTIIISGSIIGMIKKVFEEQGSPLHGRADIKIELKPLEMKVVFEILDDLGIKSIEEKVKFYLIFGGIPYYYSLAWKYSVKSLKEALRRLVFEEHAPLRNEVEIILREAFGKEYHTYASILSAISEGATKLVEIANKIGLKPTSLPPYLK
ncbi:MAG TPA: ATP-binding protein, partial [Thermoproteales archaeon]|nr:ATP-binding protein [Thermoproteales archaeon]